MTVITSRVSDSKDDASELHYDQGTETTYNRLATGGWNNRYCIGMRFYVSIPAGATITNAKITFQSGYDDTGNFSSILWAEDNATPLAFDSINAHDITDRASTVVTVDWNIIEDWVSSGFHDSPDITGIIQELVNSYDYSVGGYIVLAWQATRYTSKYRVAVAYDETPANAPLLTISYTD